LLSLSYPVASSAVVLLAGVRRYEMTTARVLRGALMEASLLALVAAVLAVRGWTIERIGLQFSARAAFAGLPLFVCYMLLYWSSSLIVVALFPEAAHGRGFQFVIRASPAATLLFVVINSLFEEVIVAGYVVSALTPQGVALSITASTLLRFLYHLYQGPQAAVSILPLGLLFGAVYWKWRNLWPLIIAHTITNVLALIAMGQPR
jgi:membrane protease YdiL (CAAX protease family)